MISIIICVYCVSYFFTTSLHINTIFINIKYVENNNGNNYQYKIKNFFVNNKKCKKNLNFIVMTLITILIIIVGFIIFINTTSKSEIFINDQDKTIYHLIII